LADSPTKLFATLSERYPEADGADAARKAVERIIDQVPIIGTIATFTLSQFLIPSLERRKDEFFRELAGLVEEMSAKVDGFRPELLAENEAFVSALIQSARIAVGTHRQEKRSYLRNALFRIATDRAPEDDIQQMYLRYIDELTPMHIWLLALLADEELVARKSNGLGQGGSFNYARYIGEAVSNGFRRHRWHMLEPLLNDLRVRGLCTVSGLNDQFDGRSPVTIHGKSFLCFIAKD
jgi:hypothetical protein